MSGLVLLFFDLFFGEVLLGEVTEGAVGVFGGVVIFPWFIVLIARSAEETLELVLA